ncbi:MAG: hypothetical protein L7S67_06690 [Flavobacteriales bacterium]|nr:hypothetical protein [Flavobacteriales bacterium]
MIKPSFLVKVKDGKPIVDIVSLDADEILDAYKSSSDEVYAFIRPGYTKRKRAIEKAPAPLVKKAAKKASKKS